MIYKVAMARIRTIRPEFWASEEVMDCSVTARLFFIGLRNFCDDAGRALDLPRSLRMRIFPGDDISTADVEALIDELASNGLIDRYEVGGKRYLQVASWRRDQKINRP